MDGGGPDSESRYFCTLCWVASKMTGNRHHPREDAGMTVAPKTSLWPREGQAPM